MAYDYSDDFLDEFDAWDFDSVDDNSLLEAFDLDDRDDDCELAGVPAL